MDASASVLAVRPAPVAVALRPAPAANGPRLPPFAPEIVAHHQPDDPVSGQYRELLAAVTPPAAGQGAPALLLAPALPGADAVVVLLNLAVTAARQGNRRVVVVDADPRQPAVAERLGLPARPGLSDVLAGAVALEQALQPTGQANLTVLTAGAGAGGAAARGRDAGLGVASTPAALRSGAGTRADVGRAARSGAGRGL